MTNALRFGSVMGTSRHRLARAGLTIAAIAAAAVASVAISPGQERTVQAIGDALGAGGEFHAITPARILDTRDRNLDPALFGRKPSDSLANDRSFEVPVVGRGGLPAFSDEDGDGYDDNVLAVVVSIIAVSPTSVGYLRAFPAGATQGDTSVINFDANQIVPNSAVLRPGKGGKIAIRLVTPRGPGTSDVVIDVSGWFSTSQYETAAGVPRRGARLIPISPIRAYDSGLTKFGAKPLGARGQIEVPVRGAVDASSPSVPVPDNDNIIGVVANITGQNVFSGSRATYLSALRQPVASGKKPATSTVNLLPGQTRANLAILPVDANGSIHVFNLNGQIRLVVDIVGYLRAGDSVDTQLGRVIPLVAPFRVFDTRLSEHENLPLGPANSEPWGFDDVVNDVTIDGEWVGDQVGLLGNLTATNLQPQYLGGPVASFITAYPSDETGPATPPKISNLNIVEGESVPNLALLKYGHTAADSHSLQFYNRAGYVDYLLDMYAVVLAD